MSTVKRKTWNYREYFRQGLIVGGTLTECLLELPEKFCSRTRAFGAVVGDETSTGICGRPPMVNCELVALTPKKLVTRVRGHASGQVEPHRVGESHVVPERDIDGAVDGSALNCERQSQGTQAAEGSIACVPSIKDLLDVEGYRRTVGRTSGKATASQFDRGRRIERERQIDHFPRHRHECDSGCKTTRLLRGLRRPNLWWGRDNRPRPIQRRKRLLNGSDC